MSRSTHLNVQPGLTETRIPGFGERLAYGFGDVASNLVFIAVASFLTFFYTDVVGIDAGTVGTIFLVSRLIAAVSDFAIGIAMEKRSRRGGKALPWLKWFAVPFGLSVALMFSAPDLGDTGKIVYAFITFNLCASVIYSAINIPYGVLATLMTKDQHGRALLNTFRMVGCYVGSIAITAVTLPLVGAFGNTSLAWTYTFLIIGALVTALFFITFRFCREAVTPAEDDTLDAEKAPQVRVAHTLGILVRNRYWMILLGFGIVLNVLLTLPGVSLYYAKWVLGDEAIATSILTLRMIAELSGVLLAVPFVRRWGKRNASLAACLVIIAGQALILIDPSALGIVIAAQCVAGIGAGAILGSIFAMIGDVNEHVEWRSHVRAEGIVYSGISVGQKIGAGIGSMIIGMLLASSGYVSSATVQPDTAIDAIRFMFVWLPTISAVAMAALLIGYTLDRTYPRILSDLAARREAARG